MGGVATPIWITPKFSIPVKKDQVNVGLGGLFATTTGGGRLFTTTTTTTGGGGSFGILYGMTTFGNRDKNFTLGLGWGYSDGKIASQPTISFSSLIRTGARGYFITENYYIAKGSSSLVLLSFGGRRIINRTGLDFGLFIPVTSETKTFRAFPWLGITTLLH